LGSDTATRLLCTTYLGGQKFVLPWLEKESMDTPQKGVASFKSFKFLFICSFFHFFLEARSG
jgi:hypothetical protein